jgi:hypothetical protein
MNHETFLVIILVLVFRLVKNVSSYIMKDKACDKSMSFSDCELAILRMQVDEAEAKIAKRMIKTEETQEMISIVENFIKKKALVCYGGISINALLPEQDKIYNEDIDLPDYDFFSPNALKDAKELADLYFEKGYTEVEAKAGQHHGTFKVFVNFQGVADITLIPFKLYNIIKKKAIRVNGILYTDPNFLRMSMYLELSRPAGDTSRWEKVLKRLILLNKHYPLTDLQCNTIDFQRKMEYENENKADEIYETVKNAFVNQGVVFFGGFAISQYSQYMPAHLKKKIEKIADFDVLSKDPLITAEITIERLKDIGIHNAKIIKRPNIGEIIPLHYEIKVGNDTVAFIYEPIGCHSYNILIQQSQKIKIATIDTMLSFYLAFLYAGEPYYDNDRILCMSKFLFDVQQKNRLSQKGLLKRFSIVCYGHQESVEEMKSLKAKKIVELKNKKGTPEYDEWFLKYNPVDKQKDMSYVKNIHAHSFKNHSKTRKQINSMKKTKKKNKTVNKYWEIY